MGAGQAKIAIPLTATQSLHHSTLDFATMKADMARH
jgi:hypothetical protein